MAKSLTKERWEPLAFCNGKYSVSNFGRVRSNYYMSCKWRVTVKGKILKPNINKNGYYILSMTWYESGKRFEKTKKIHRLVCETFHLNPENKPQVNHKDLDRLNNHFRNLEWATAKENTNHAQRMGRVPIAKPYIKKGKPDSYKPVIDFNTGIFWTSDEVAFLLNTKRRYVHRLLTEERKPNTTQYRYA